MMVAVVAVAAGSVGLVSVPAQAEPPPPDVKEVAVEEGVAAPAADGIAGTPVVADQTGTVDVAALAAEAPSLPASPDEPVEVPLGDAPDLPTGALDPDLIRPDDPSVTGTIGAGDPDAAPGEAPQAPGGGSAEPEPTPPGLATNFQGVVDTGWIPPDTDGAVGPNHVVNAVNGGVRIQSRTGAAISQVTLNDFWSPVLTSGNSFDPRILYDRFNGRWIMSAVDNSNSASSSLLLGVTTTSDPTGTWILRRYDTDADNNEWADFPTMGFNKNWITVGLNMFQIGGGFTRPQVYAIDKAALYAGGSGTGVFWGALSSSDYGFTLMPATTEDNTTDTQYLARVWGQLSGSGYLALHTITGTVASPTLGTVYAYPAATGASWSGSAGVTNIGPQLGGNPVNIGDDRLHAVVYRGGKLWISHHVFLPATSPNRAAVQWWSVTASTGAVLQRGRIDSGSASTSFGYPSLAVNANEDVLVGYSRFGSSQYPSANYAFRYGTDAAGTLQGDTLLKAGEANYVRTDSVSRNRWGDYSSTHVDPVNGTDLWTLQEYARTGNTWGTWWARITPQGVAAPPNDAFANATVLPSASGTLSGTNVGATKETGEPNHGDNAGGASIWYRFTAPASGVATVDTVGSSLDTLLGVYTGSAVNGLTLVAGNDDSGNALTSAVQFTATAGTTYRIAVDGFANLTAATGSVNLNWSFPTIGGVSGTVLESGSGTPVAGAWVALLRSADFSLAGGAVADANGDYTLAASAGTYYAYVIDPTGRHVAGFHGPPTLVTVTPGTFIDVDPSTASTRGSISGTIRETGTNTPIFGAWAVALSTDPATTGAIEVHAVANASGQYSLNGLSARNHFVGWIDPTGNHASRFAPNALNVPDSTPVNVPAAGTAVSNGSLPVQAGTGGGQTLQGTVTEDGTGAPLSGVYVVALQAADFRMARGAVTNAAGGWSMSLATGSYKLAFFDGTGLHLMEWHSNQPSTGLANAASVSPPQVVNAGLGVSTGRMTGTVTDAPSGLPLNAAWVLAIGPFGIAGGAVTGGNGTYTVADLPPGTYRATFVDPTGARRQEFWDDSLTIDGSTPFGVAAGQTVTRNAGLSP